MRKESPQMRMPSGDGFNVVQFKWEQQRNNTLSQREGRPIYDNVLMAYVTSPGKKNQIATVEIERRVWNGDDADPLIVVNHDKMAIYGDLLNAWRENGGGDHVGTPLDAITFLDAAQVATLEEMGIHTVEELASIADSALFMGAREWRERAKAYLEQAKGQKPISDLIARNKELEEEVEALRKQVDDLVVRLSDEGGDVRVSRGRRRKKEAV